MLLGHKKKWAKELYLFNLDLVAQFYGIFGFRISALWSQMCKAQ
jgi:hypothetical protein